MPLITLKNITVSFGHPPLLNQISFQIEARERVCLVGRNGSGKSTVMKLIKGEIKPDDGEIAYERGVSIAELTQEVPQNISGKVSAVVAKGLPNVESWKQKHLIEEVLSRLNLNGAAEFENLSGGLKRRALLAKAIIAEPDLLLLDEPTNHLDIENILWLEQFFAKYNKTLLFVTHDRVFLEKIAARIIELDRGNLTNWNCDYRNYLERKQALLEAEEKENALFDKKLAEEERWIRQGIKARRTRNEGRVRELKQLRRERQERREQIGKVNLQLQQADKSGKIVIEAENVSYAYDNDKSIIKNFSTTILRGDKIGIIGPNGCGKTTLIQLLLGNLEPTSGQIKQGTQLQIAYFDQLRSQLNEEKTVRENVGGGSDSVTINGKEKHIIGYLQDFLFSPDRANSPVNQLSGGERNRLLLAKLFTKPSNVLVLDEPTNDLDIETLELLEDLLVEYPGTVLLVSHDRAFLNNIVTSTLVFERDDEISEYVGGYDDWLRQRPIPIEIKTEVEKPQKNQDRRALEKILKRIEKVEKEQENLHQIMADPAFYQKSKEEISNTQQQLSAVEKKLEILYQEWEALEI
ncbi:MAG: ATP-binding cassette domain-containing protein [Gammaproteobacteria bacterium]